MVAGEGQTDRVLPSSYPTTERCVVVYTFPAQEGTHQGSEGGLMMLDLNHYKEKGRELLLCPPQAIGI